MTRNHASLAVPGVGLALCGVGYSLDGNAHQNVLPPVNPEEKEIIEFYQKREKEEFVMEGKKGEEEQHSENDKEENQSEKDATNPSSHHTNEGGGGARKRRLNRRERFHEQRKNKLLKSQEGLDSAPNQCNISNIDSFLQNGNAFKLETTTSLSFQEELTNYNSELLFYPERLFHFSFGNILFPQSSTTVGTTIWDAEIILAHFLDNLPAEELIKLSLGGNHSDRQKNSSCLLELGAGTGLAGMIASQKQCFQKVLLQEIDEVFPFLTERTNEFVKLYPSNDCEVHPASCLWNTEGITKIRDILSTTAFTLQITCMIMADVLYHIEDFQLLLEMITNLLALSGNLLLSFELRRKDLNPFLFQLRKYFKDCFVYEYHITSKKEKKKTVAKDEGKEATEGHHHSSETELPRSSKLYLLYFKEFLGSKEK
jgi:predicted nicotinamide N-methyase